MCEAFLAAGDPPDLPDADLVCSAQGAVVHASRAATDWLALPGFRQRLQQYITQASQRGHAPLAGYAGAEIEVTALQGRAGARFLARVRSGALIPLSPWSRLTQRQWSE